MLENTEKTVAQTSKELEEVSEDRVATDEEVKNILNNIFNQ